MDSTKTFAEWEQEKGVVYRLAEQDLLNQQFSEADFISFLNENMQDMCGVNHAVRTEFLQTNGYDVTRDNLVNNELSTRLDYDPNAVVTEAPTDDGNISVI